MYFALRDLRSTFDYASLAKVLARSMKLHDSSAAVTGFSIVAPDNEKQTAFLSSLRSQNFTLILKESRELTVPSDHVSFFPDMLARVVHDMDMGVLTANGSDVVVFITDDPAAARVLPDFALDAVACFFSERLHGPWVTAIANDTLAFMDLSSPELRKALVSRYHGQA